MWGQDLLPEIWNSLPYQLLLSPYCEENGGTNHMPSLVYQLPWKSKENDLINFDWAFWLGTCWHSKMADVDSKKVADWEWVLCVQLGFCFGFVWKKNNHVALYVLFWNSMLAKIFLNNRFANASPLTSTELVVPMSFFASLALQIKGVVFQNFRANVWPPCCWITCT